MRVLIIEDEVNLALPLVALLEKNKILADTVADGTSGLMLARKPVYDVIVLDIMLPEIDGLTILKTLREEHNNTPILLLTALDNIDDRVKGLNLGADDYLTKPFDTKELIARIKALSRRGSGSITEEVLHIGNVSLNVNNASLSIGDREETLTKKEANLLETLMKNKDNVLSKDYILKKHANSPFISYYQAKKIEISSKQDVIIDIDGEEGSLLPVTIQVIHKAINILIP